MSKFTRSIVPGVLAACLFPLEVFALHEGPIYFRIWDEYAHQDIPITIRYCDPVYCPQTGFLQLGASVYGYFDINESPSIDFGTAPFSAAEIGDYAISIGAGYGSAWSGVTLLPADTHVGNGQTGPATSWYGAGTPTIESGGTIWREMYQDRHGYVDGLIELTALTADLGSDMGLKYYFNLETMRMDVYGFMNPDPNNADLRTAVLIASTANVPLPAAAWLFSGGLLSFLGLARRNRIASRHQPVDC